MSIQKTFVLFLALRITTAGLAYTQEMWNEFKSFVDQTDKKYLSKTELQYRFSIYIDRKAAIEKFNAEDHSYKKGVNMFTDFTLEERKSVFGAVNLSTNVDSNKDVLKPAENPFKSNLANGERRLQTGSDGLDAISPRTFDWECEGKVTPPKNHGCCASSYAFATVAQLESYYLMSNDRSYDLSEQQLVDCSFLPGVGNNGCFGGSNTMSFLHVFKRGISNECDYPYNGKLGLCKLWKTDRLYFNKAYYVPARFFDYYIYNLSLTPIASTFYASDDLLDYCSGIFDAKTHCHKLLPPNYSALAVGYNLAAENRFIRFKGNWGTGWGDNGFFKMSFDYEDYQNGPCNLLSHNDSIYAI